MSLLNLNTYQPKYEIIIVTLEINFCLLFMTGLQATNAKLNNCTLPVSELYAFLYSSSLIQLYAPEINLFENNQIYYFGIQGFSLLVFKSFKFICNSNEK